jgi:hypothetical protein
MSFTIPRGKWLPSWDRTGQVRPHDAADRLCRYARFGPDRGDRCSAIARAAEHLGYLPENGPLYPDMTPMSLLQFFGGRGLAGAKLQRVDSVVISVPWNGRTKPIGKLSKGYAARVDGTALLRPRSSDHG